MSLMMYELWKERVPTLRDQFAMAALPALIEMTELTKADQIPRVAYLIADHMLKERTNAPL